MSDAHVQADPGNSAPEAWSEPLSEQEQQEAKDRLAAESAEAEKDRERARAEADYQVVDGKVTAIDKADENASAESDEPTAGGVYSAPTTGEPAEPAPVEYRNDEDVAQDAEPIEQAVDQPVEVDVDGG